MSNPSPIVFDMETDGLLSEVTKIHVVSYTMDGVNFYSLTDYDEMRDFFLGEAPKVCHNAARYDYPVVRKVLGINPRGPLYDTLVLSWYLNIEPNIRHGLEAYGERFGVKKPFVSDWKNLSIEEYCHRCEEDVKINWLLWKWLEKRLVLLYADDTERERLIRYLTFKMECAAEQERLGIRLDVEGAKVLRDKLTALQAEKVEELRSVLPMVPKYREVTKPKVWRKKDGTLSANAEKYIENGGGEDIPSIQILSKMEEPNPNSPEQIKDFLFSLGWEPQTFNVVMDEITGEERSIPQVRDKQTKELCPSVSKLAEKEPKVKVLEGLSVISHRLSFVNNLLKSQRDGRVKATVAGLTNTFRFKHAAPLCNIPSVEKAYGKEIRSLLLADDGEFLCGSDMVSLESTTKRHYMWPYDPEYVKEMSKDGFDEHLDLARFAGAVTSDQVERHKNGEEDLSAVRKLYKATNYSAVYGVGAKKLGRELSIPVDKAQAILDAYWERNWAVKAFSEDCKTRVIGGTKWVKNPVSGFWHSLRADKDIFSTVNQSTGVYCFDRWVAEQKRAGVNVVGQFHDEVINPVKEGHEDTHEAKLKDAIKRVNDHLKLNVTLDVDVKFGYSYAEVH